MRCATRRAVIPEAAARHVLAIDDTPTESFSEQRPVEKHV